jgi:trimeric autotransporter adhesin
MLTPMPTLCLYAFDVLYVLQLPLYFSRTTEAAQGAAVASMLSAAAQYKYTRVVDDCIASCGPGVHVAVSLVLTDSAAPAQLPSFTAAATATTATTAGAPSPYTAAYTGGSVTPERTGSSSAIAAAAGAARRASTDGCEYECPATTGSSTAGSRARSSSEHIAATVSAATAGPPLLLRRHSSHRRRSSASTDDDGDDVSGVRGSRLPSRQLQLQHGMSSQLSAQSLRSVSSSLGGDSSPACSPYNAVHATAAAASADAGGATTRDATVAPQLQLQQQRNWELLGSASDDTGQLDDDSSYDPWSDCVFSLAAPAAAGDEQQHCSTAAVFTGGAAAAIAAAAAAHSATVARDAVSAAAASAAATAELQEQYERQHHVRAHSASGMIGNSSHYSSSHARARARTRTASAFSEAAVEEHSSGDESDTGAAAAATQAKRTTTPPPANSAAAAAGAAAASTASAAWPALFMRYTRRDFTGANNSASNGDASSSALFGSSMFGSSLMLSAAAATSSSTAAGALRARTNSASAGTVAGGGSALFGSEHSGSTSSRVVSGVLRSVDSVGSLKHARSSSGFWGEGGNLLRQQQQQPLLSSNTGSMLQRLGSYSLGLRDSSVALGTANGGSGAQSASQQPWPLEVRHNLFYIID